ncbi:hypothetical protein AWB82_06493 [Caballeronia glebae]|uniref:NAD-specific glutamate dehydrogenase n=1 Tax=Caballeronia glebae TaxID=1777143 RepID=A0A158DAI3_9BURK|nr:hypothetical protein AWB82_06493 [Caballeronia glebae]
MFERANVIGVEVHRFLVAGILLIDLLLETRGLVFRIVQLRKAVGDLAAGDEQLETLRDARLRIRCARERRHFDRIVDDIRRLPQLRFRRLFEQRELQRTDTRIQELGLRRIHAELLQFRAQERGVGQLRVGVLRRELLNGLIDRQTMKRLGEIELASLIHDGRGAERIDRGLADQLLGEVHQPAVIGVRGVELHHREFRVVTRRHAFVPEVTIDLEHALEAADDQPLQIQLGRDAQEHLHVERVVMRGERLGRRAARNRVQHRRFDFHEARLRHEIADRRDRLGARHEGLARFRRDDQIDVALAIAHFLIGEAVELVRQRAQRLREQPQFRAAHRQLALVRAKQHALRGDDVAEVPLLEGVVSLLADVGGRHEELDLATAVLNRREARLAHHALEHHPAGDSDGQGIGFERLFIRFGVVALERGGLMRRAEIVRIGDALLAQRTQFVASLGDDLVLFQFGSGARLSRFGHD